MISFSFDVFYANWLPAINRDRDSKNRLEYNEFAYKKTKDDCKLEDRFQKKAISGLHVGEIADKKTAYNKGRLFSKVVFCSVTNILRSNRISRFK